jgi:DNA-binding transcriptional ArsR family regulator
MSKTFETKNRIIELLGKKRMTLSQLSEELHLAPSTIEQHLKELERASAIRNVEDPYTKKWKYYTLGDNPDVYNTRERPTGMPAGQKIVVTLALALIASLAFLLYAPSAPAYAPNSTFLIQLTDPPIVPSGTQAVIVSYGALALRQSGLTNSTGFVEFNLSGTVNLLNLTNVTQTIGVIKAKTNETFDMVRLYVSSAKILIGNATYNVTVPSGFVSARIGPGLNSSSGGLVIDMNTVVLQIYTNSTHSVFVMVPSVSAVVVGKTEISSSELKLGYRSEINASEAERLRAAASSIRILNASASTSNGITHISVTVENNGNSTVVLKHVILSGSMLAIPRYTIINANINANQTGVVNPGDQVPPVLGDNSGAANESSYANTLTSVGTPSEVSVNATDTTGEGATANSHGNATGAASMGLNQSDKGAADIQNHGSKEGGDAAIVATDSAVFNEGFHNNLNFLVTSNGALVLPFDGMEAEDNSGYNIPPGATATLTFTGVISFGTGSAEVADSGAPAFGHGNPIAIGAHNNASGRQTARLAHGYVVISLIPNQTYLLSVTGNEDARASANVTASGSLSLNSSNMVNVTSVNIVVDNIRANSTSSDTLPGFTAQAGSYVYYYITDYCGGVQGSQAATDGAAQRSINGQSSEGVCVPAISNASFSSNSPGFTILGAALERYDPLSYLLKIGMPNQSYTGPLSIAESYGASVPEPAQGSNASVDGIISGIVSIGPLCPVENENATCPGQMNRSELYTSRHILLNSKSGNGGYAISINANGSFSEIVPAGEYTLSISNCTFVGCGSELPKSVVIRPNQTATTKISIDTGIR